MNDRRPDSGSDRAGDDDPNSSGQRQGGSTPGFVVFVGALFLLALGLMLFLRIAETGPGARLSADELGGGAPPGRVSEDEVIYRLLERPRSAEAPETSEGVDVITPPEWVRLPDARAMADAYPAAALRNAVEGQAMISCTVAADGLLTECVVAAEQPEGYGFGEAALVLAPRFEMRPQMRNGEPVGGAQVNVPLRFKLQ